MTLLEEIYCDVVATLAATGEDDDRTLAANQLRAIRNRLESEISPAVILEAKRKAAVLCKSRDNY